ncbi:M56 family metallopeptidase [Paludisphaera soli]|uniref:M56 family metallopeptidase n=1 Tax=Paludisphaera soli TaxID=2712865 RepID=UPI0013ECB588|nr:M56 family metallopeptidase [Paludisphaera soli]
MSPLPNSPAWTALGWTFLHMLWIGAAIGLAASIARRLLRRAAAEARHAAALASLVLLTVAPFGTFAVVHVPAPAATAAIADPPAARVPTPSRAAPRAAVTARRPWIAPASKPESPNRLRFLDAWIPVLPGVWLVGSALTLAWLATGLAGVGRLRREALPLEAGPVVERARALARSLGIARVAVAACDRIAAPVLIGVVRPMILLPTAALTGWSPEQLEMALLHELAHLRRRDNLVGLFQKLAEALLFFHPTTWWLSAWVRLERETCCDRLVVARTDRPRAYAELLAALAAARPAPAPALSLTERPITTRIRRILLKEDPPMTMKPTAPEALALAAATLLAAALVLPTRAQPPAEQPKADVRTDLQRIAEAVAALPDVPNPGGPTPPDERIVALTQIARKQLDQGDRAGALKTLNGVKIGPLAGKDLSRDLVAVMNLGILIESAAIRYDAGEVETARAQFRQVVELVAKPDPAADAAMMRVLTKLFDAISAKQSVPEDPRPLQRMSDLPLEPGDEPVDPELVGMKLEILGQLLESLADRREFEAMRPVVAYVVGLVGPSHSPAVTVNLDSFMGVKLIRAGDEPAGRELIARARKLVDEAPAGESKTFLARTLARSIAEVDLDAALELAATLPPRRRDAALRDMIEGLCSFDPIDWTDASGIKIVIGDPALRPKDDAAARAALAKIAAVAKGTDEPVLRARTLAAAAHLQARAGDVAGALATVEAIPDIRRVEHPGPNDGFYDSVKPATFALIAWRRSQAGDEAGADAAFARSKELTAAVAHDAERLIAEIVLAQKLEATGRGDEANAMLADALPRALEQPEPRRSRMLERLAQVQLRTSGVAEAARTVDAIRDEPGLEKARALRSLAVRLRDDGDPEAARPYARRALACLQPRPSDPGPIAGQSVGVMRNGFLDYDQETPFHPISAQRASLLPGIRRLAGEPDMDTSTISPGMEVNYHVSKVHAAFQGDGIEGALKTAEAIDSPATRLVVLQNLAYSLGFEADGL